MLNEEEIKKHNKKYEVLRKILLVIGIILALLTIFQIIMAGFRDVNIYYGIILPILLIVFGLSTTKQVSPKRDK